VCCAWITIVRYAAWQNTMSFHFHNLPDAYFKTFQSKLSGSHIMVMCILSLSPVDCELHWPLQLSLLLPIPLLLVRGHGVDGSRYRRARDGAVASRSAPGMCERDHHLDADFWILNASSLNMIFTVSSLAFTLPCFHRSFAFTGRCVFRHGAVRGRADECWRVALLPHLLDSDCANDD
jgi:hypothetical protein